ncbi:hypothetical protein M433DRAFT_209959 [Acidomyces richmondensis BFW]|nr:hypothetical protein M433DRAFT_209959 [Acidomyces richmondensis BFW]
MTRSGSLEGGLFMTPRNTKPIRSPDGLSNGPPAIPTETETITSLPPGAPASQMSASTASDGEPLSPTSLDSNAMTDSVDSILGKLTVSPQTIPEGKIVEHTVTSPVSTEGVTSPISRNSSMRSMAFGSTRPARIPGSGSRRSSRRSTSNSISPAHAFLSSWTRENPAVEPAVEPKPDDEGQEIGLEGERYVIGRRVSSGGFGVIKEVHSITQAGNRVVRAVKIVRKSVADKDPAENEKAQQELEHEVSVWRHLEHRHILRLHAVYDTEYATFCLMDLNVGGTLFDVVRKSRLNAIESGGRKGLEPKLAKKYAYQLASALRYLHQDVRVCHRDVKLENCLIDMTVPNAETEGGFLRLCDFGLADFLHSDSGGDDDSPERFGLASASGSNYPTTSSVIGTLEYASPRGLSVNRKLFETAGDVWAYGVIIYTLCTGDLPFKDPFPARTVDRIMSADWDHTALKHAAAGADDVIDLVRGCLEKDIDIRFTIGDAMRSSWFDGAREPEEGPVAW